MTRTPPTLTVAPPGQGAMRPGEVVALALTATIYLGVLASVFLF